MLKPALIALVAVAALMSAQAQADQILGAPRIDSGNNLKLPGGPTLGKWIGNKYNSTPDSLTLPSTADPASGGDLSPFSLKPTGGTFARTQAQLAMDTGPSLLSFIPAGTTYAQFLTDATSTLQNAANVMCAKSPKGGVIRLPALTLNLPATTTISWTCPIQWIGQGWNELAIRGGTQLHITGTAVSPFTITHVDARGSAFRDLGVYQDHPAPPASSTDLNWAPTVYPYVFDINGTAGTITFDNIFLGPVYDLIRANLAGRLDVGNVRGQVFHNAFKLDLSYDTSHFWGQLHFWGFWSAHNAVYGWQVANQDLFILGRVDGLEAPDVFTFASRSGVRLIQTAAADQIASNIGFATKIHFGSFYCDSCKYGLWSNVSAGSGAYQQPQIVFENLSSAALTPGSETAVPIPGAAAIQVDVGGGADISIGRLMSEGAILSPVNLANTSYATRLRIGDLFSRSNTGPAINQATKGFADNVSIATIPTVPGALTNSKVATFSAPLQNGGVLSMTSGGTLASVSFVQGYVLTGANPTASFTVTLPATPYDGQEVYYSPVVNVTAVSFVVVAPATGVLNAPPSLTAGVPVAFKYIAGITTWVRR